MQRCTEADRNDLPRLSNKKREFSNIVSVIPRRLIGGLHEWRNERPTVPALDLVNLLLGEHAEDF